MLTAHEILIVEDDQVIRMTLQEILEAEGHRVHAVENGRVALAWLKSAPALPSLILLDLMMPVMNGNAFLAAAKQDVPGFERVPIMVLTAAGRTEIPLVGGQLHLLKKPLEIDDLLALADRLLSDQSPAFAVPKAPVDHFSARTHA